MSRTTHLYWVFFFLVGNFGNFLYMVEGSRKICLFCERCHTLPLAYQRTDNFRQPMKQSDFPTRVCSHYVCVRVCVCLVVIMHQDL